MSSTYSQFVSQLKEIKTLTHVGAILAWDQETMMPPAGAETRAEQLALLTRLAHERLTSPHMSELFADLKNLSERSEVEVACIREARRAWERETKLSSSLVEELARTQSLAQHAWITARKNSDFSQFAPWLEKLIELKRHVARAIAPHAQDTELYDVLLDEYEPGAKSSALIPLFQELETKLSALLKKIQSQPQSPQLTGNFPVEIQKEFGLRLAQAMGFDLEAGRLDVSAHPFCTSFGPRDVRITTRFDAADFTGAIFGILHETGHALYEQGLPVEHLGTPLAEAASMAIHESQSRLWENHIGRSHAFWEHFYPEMQRAFPDALSRVTLEAFYRSINRVHPSLIRTESDEVTYNLHIALRFDLERRLIDKTLSVADLPSAWNAGMQRLLGITPSSDAQGVLQDVHWSMGAFGYFPTYTLGNLYAAQLMEAAERAIPKLRSQISQGELLPLRNWLKEQIHRHGMHYPPDVLCKRVTGAPLSAGPFLKYLEQKFGGMDGL